MTPLQTAFDVFARTPATKVLVAVSGGKDSICTLDLCVRHFGAKNVTGFLMELVQDVECEWAPVRALERKFGVKVIGVPHWDLAGYLKAATYREEREEHNKLRTLKQVDVENHLRKLTGVDYIAWGVRGSDSLTRNAWLKQCRGVDTKGRRIFPLYSWRKPDVYGYLHARKLPVPGIAGGGANSGGINVTPELLIWLRDRCPHRDPGGQSRCLERMLVAFPYAGVAIYRHEVMGIDPVAAVKARHRKTRSNGKAAAQGQAQEHPAPQAKQG